MILGASYLGGALVAGRGGGRPIPYSPSRPGPRSIAYLASGPYSLEKLLEADIVIGTAGQVLTTVDQLVEDPAFSATLAQFVRQSEATALIERPLRRSRPAAAPLAVAGPAAVPVVTLSKGSGASGVAVAGGGGGTGYVVGDQITVAGGTVGSYPAVLQVITAAAGAITGISVIRRGVYTAVPANPVAQASTTGAGTGATFTMTWGAGSAASMGNATDVSTGFRFTGNGPLNGGNQVGAGTPCIWEWCSYAPQMDIRLAGSNMAGMLSIDGVRVGTGFTTDASGAPYIMSIDWTGTANPYDAHTYEIYGLNASFGGVRVSTADKVWEPNTARQGLAWWLSDSYGVGIGALNVGLAVPRIAGQVAGIEVLADAIGGSGWSSTGNTAPAKRVEHKLGPLTQTPNYAVLDLGYNDGNGPDTARIAASFDETIAAIRLLHPAIRIFCFGPATPAGPTTGLDLVRATLIARSSAWGVEFIDVRSLVDTLNKGLYTGGDQVHPNNAGHRYIGVRKGQLLRDRL